MKTRAPLMVGLGFVALATAASLAACGSSGSGTLKGSCTATTATYCLEYYGSSYTAASVQAACVSPQVFSSSACSTTNKVATCVVGSGTASEFKYTYYSPGYSASSAQTNCTANSGTIGS